MKKKQKILKKILLKKKYFILNIEKSLIQKSVFNNLKIKNKERFIIKKLKKKKILSQWQNACFHLALYKKLWKKNIMSRFSVKLFNNNAKIPNIKVKSW